MSLKSPNKTFGAVPIINGKTCGSINEIKRKRNQNYKEEKKLGRGIKKIKANVKGKSPTNASEFTENDPNNFNTHERQFQLLKLPE